MVCLRNHEEFSLPGGLGAWEGARGGKAAGGLQTVSERHVILRSLDFIPQKGGKWEGAKLASDSVRSSRRAWRSLGPWISRETMKSHLPLGAGCVISCSVKLSLEVSMSLTLKKLYIFSSGCW